MAREVRTPYQGWGQWYNGLAPQSQPQPQYNQWQYRDKQAAPRAQGSGSGSLNDILMGYLNNTPATPQYASAATPSLPNYAPVNVPASIPAPTYPSYAGATVPGQVTPPTLPSVGNVSRPSPLVNQQLPIPQLRPGVSLQEMAGTTLPYQSIDFSSIFGAAPTAQAIQGYDWAASLSGSTPTGSARVNSGINPMPAPEAPRAILPKMNATASAQAQQVLQPAMMQNMVNHYQSAADYQNAAQKAVAQSGLNWATLAQLLGNVNAQGRMGQQGNMLGFLGGMNAVI